MEARKITIVSTKNQKKSVIMSEAETLGQLKDDLYNAGIDYTDMTFYEGVSKTELVHDDSVLPTNVPYTNRRTGETINTNELVFMLTNQNKKIKSGAGYSRRECYDLIREWNLQDEVRNTFGKNFTQCSTHNLNSFIDSQNEIGNYDVEEEECETCDVDSCKDNLARLAIKLLAEALKADYEEAESVLELLDSLDNEDNELESSYSDEELSEMEADSIH